MQRMLDRLPVGVQVAIYSGAGAGAVIVAKLAHLKLARWMIH
jgi:hypothetical protein